MVEGMAFQEALLVEVILAVTVLVMIYRGFRRWLQYKEKLGERIAEQAAERATQYGAQIERVEARLRMIEQIVALENGQPAAQIDALPTSPVPGAIAKSGTA
jgi:hypothetical protein